MTCPHERPPLIRVEQVSHAFKQREGLAIHVLEQCQLELFEGEIVALLGKSGSGKSTLLRIIAGLIEPTDGEVWYQGEPVHEPVPSMGMVFQQFALLPWLTVLENVELGLEAKGLDKQERRERALDMIDMVGMDGFESAYPKELSGGMCQRVGIARALVTNPYVLLMDEPFSALDVLTTDNLKGDLLDLWHKGQTALKSLLMVTHSIEEAAFMADRILIFGANPGHVHTEINVSLPHPRQEDTPGMDALVDEIYEQIAAASGQHQQGNRSKHISLHHRLPRVDTSAITGLLEELSNPEHDQKVDMAELADELQLDLDEFFQIVEVVDILGLVQVSEHAISLKPAGQQIARADILQKKKIFAQQLLQHVPLARHILRVLKERPQQRASEDRFLAELQDNLTEDAAEEVLKVVIDWGRYAELFAYHAPTGTLSLDDPE